MSRLRRGAPASRTLSPRLQNQIQELLVTWPVVAMLTGGGDTYIGHWFGDLQYEEERGIGNFRERADLLRRTIDKMLARDGVDVEAAISALATAKWAVTYEDDPHAYSIYSMKGSPKSAQEAAYRTQQLERKRQLITQTNIARRHLANFLKVVRKLPFGPEARRRFRAAATTLDVLVPHHWRRERVRREGRRPPKPWLAKLRADLTRAGVPKSWHADLITATGLNALRKSL